MNARAMGTQSANRYRTWLCLAGSITGVVASGAWGASQAAYGATSESTLQQAISNTDSQPDVQLKGTDVSSEKGVSNSGKPFHVGGEYTYNAKFEMDNGAYDELLNEQSKDAMGSINSQLFITNKKGLYMLQGKQWMASGTVPSTTLDEEAELLANLVGLTTKSSAGHTEYVGALNGTEIATLFNNEFLQAQSNTAFNKIENDLQKRTKDVVTIRTTQVDGRTVISQIKLQLDVTLSRQESIAVWGATGDQSKLKPFYLSIQKEYNNTFNRISFPSPVTGQAPSTSK